MAKSVGNIRTLADALDEHGRDALIMYFLVRPLPAAARVRRRDAGAGRARRSSGCGTSARLVERADPRRDGGRAGGPHAPSCATGSSRRCATTSTRRARWRPCSTSSRRATAGSRRARRFPAPRRRWRRCSACSASRTCSAPTSRRPGRRAAGGRARAGAPRPRLRARRRAARPARRAWATRCATPPTARCWSGSPGSDRPGPGAPLRAQLGPGGAARPSAGARAGRRGARAGASASGWPHGRAPGFARRAATSSTSCAARASTRGWWRDVEPVSRTRDPTALLDPGRRPDRRARPGPGPPEPRCRLPHRGGRRRDGRRDPDAPGRRASPRRSCRASAGRGRASADRAGGATSPPSCGEAKERGAWVYGAEAGGETPSTPTSTGRGRVVLVLGGEGKGLRPLVRRDLRRAGLDAAGRAVESLNVGPPRRRRSCSRRQRSGGRSPVPSAVCGASARTLAPEPSPSLTRPPVPVQCRAT